MHIACLDLEGVLLPEMWVAFAEKSGIDALRATTREYRDYDELMRMRLAELDRHNIRLPDLQAAIAELSPLEGAVDFLHSLRRNFQVAILSDTFYELAQPLMEQLGLPFLLCHRLEIDSEGKISGYRLRQSDPKRNAVQAFHSIGCRVVATGDSYNDVSMLKEADIGIFFSAPEEICREYPAFAAVSDYASLEKTCQQAALRLDRQ